MRNLREIRRGIACLVLAGTLGLCGCGGDAAASCSLTDENANGSAVVIDYPEMSTKGTMYGVVLKSSETELTVQSDLGTTVSFPITEKTDVSEASGGLAVGSTVKIRYSGTLNGNSAKKVKIKAISDSEKQPQIGQDALETAGKVILAVESGNLSALADVCAYPLIFDDGNEKKISTRQDLVSMGRKAVFTKRLVYYISRTDLFMTGNYSEGVMLGRSAPNIVLTNNGDGWKVSGIHLK